MTSFEAVIHLSESRARQAERLGLSEPGQSHVVLNGIDAKEVRLLAEQLPLSREALGLRQVRRQQNRYCRTGRPGG
ncbi:MAG: hypothetical protein ACE5JN_15920, partial [Candidatus Methylomirabilia bacterium]